jgi:hypothetical protein
LDLDLSGQRRADPVPEYARRLLPVRRVCTALISAVVLYAVASWLLVGQGKVRMGLPDSVPLLLTLLAAILILLSSRLRSTVLRRAFPRSAALAVNPEAVLAAYQKATLISFAILEAAALLGLLVAVTSGSMIYGIVLCAASVFGMLTRWPRASEVDRLARGRAMP